MNSFWKDQWEMFEKEVDTAMDFLFQPVSFSKKDKENLMLNPTEQEAYEKRDTSSFWKNQWEMFENEVDTALDFLFQPVNFK